MLLLFFALLLAVFANVNYRLSGSLLYPPALLCSVWTILLLILLATGHIFFPISYETLTVYVIGAAAFSIGALLATYLIPLAVVQPREARRPGAFVLTGGLILLVAVLPIYWDHIQSIAPTLGSDDYWLSLRAEMIDRADAWSAKTFLSLLLEGLSVLAALLAVTAVAEHDGSRSSRGRLILLVITALVYALMSGASSWAVILTLGLIGVDAIRKRRLDTKVLCLCGVIALTSFATIAILLGKGKTGLDATVAENFTGLVELIGLYVVGGVVAFDAVVQYPASIPAVWDIWRVFRLTANKFGADFDVPPQHAQFTNISTDYEGNVYTIYFAYYPDYGLAGVFIIMLALGAVLTLIYRLAMRGCARSTVLYAFAFAGIVLTGFSEYFFLSANFWFKAVLYTVSVYGLGFNPSSAPSRVQEVRS